LSDAGQKRFAETAERMAALQDARATETRQRIAGLLALRGDERALDVGTGAGAFALALAPLVREMVAVDVVPELLEQARLRAPANVELVEADGRELPFADGSFDVVCSARTLHHTEGPERVVAEMTRVLRPGGTMLLVDQVAPPDEQVAAALNRFEIARDASTTEILTDAALRALLAENGLALERAEVDQEPRELEHYLDLAACEGDARDRARELAPPGYTAELAWYVLRKPG
jgi:ubiquinone/menaquinone biosynthesis C-methylase UbiE